MPATEAEVRVLYEQYGPILHNRCRRIMGNDEDAHDAVQETFARVIRNWDSFREEASPLTWMYRISTNWCLNQIRNRKNRQAKHHVNREDILGAEHTEHAGGSRDDARVVRALLADTDEETQAIVIHLFFDELSRKEVGELMGISQPTLRKRIDHFMKRARRVLEAAPVTSAAAALLLLSWVLS